MIEMNRIKCGNVNCYLISDGDNAILVDTCREKFRAKILEACKPYHVKLLVLTHGHVDHVQNAAYLADELHIPIAMSIDDIDLIEDNMKQSLEAMQLLGKIVLSASISAFKKDKIQPFVPTIFLKEGDRLDSYGISAQVVALPGHTKGSIGLDLDGKYLVVGDALMNMFYPTTSMLYHNREAMLESAKKISNFGERIIYFGHGKPVDNRNWVKEKV